jgi:hypothetical protein
MSEHLCGIVRCNFSFEKWPAQYELAKKKSAATVRNRFEKGHEYRPTGEAYILCSAARSAHGNAMRSRARRELRVR